MTASRSAAYGDPPGIDLEPRGIRLDPADTVIDIDEAARIGVGAMPELSETMTQPIWPAYRPSPARSSRSPPCQPPPCRSIRHGKGPVSPRGINTRAISERSP